MQEKTLLDVFTGERPSELIYYNERSRFVDGVLLFTELNKCFPSTINTYNNKIVDVKKIFTSKYDIKPENIIEILFSDYKDQDVSYINSQLTLLIENDLIVICNGGKSGIYDIRIYFSHTTNKEKLTEVRDFVNGFHVENKNAEIGIIGNGANGLFIRFFNVNVPNVSIDEYYNDDFADIHTKILDKLNNNNFNKGVILFHGNPGTGKCVDELTIITLRNKKTKKIENISIKDFEKLI